MPTYRLTSLRPTNDLTVRSQPLPFNQPVTIDLTPAEERSFLRLAATGLVSAVLQNSTSSDVVPVASQGALPSVGEPARLYIAGNSAYTWSASTGQYVALAGGSTDLSSTVPFRGTFATMAAVESAYPAVNNACAHALVGASFPYQVVFSDGYRWRDVTSRSAGETRIVTDISQYQTLHDELVALGGGDLHLIPGATYVPAPGQQVVHDVSLVGLQMNGATIDCSGWYGVDQASSTTTWFMNITGSRLKHAVPPKLVELREIANGTFLGKFTAKSTGDWGPTALWINKSYSDDGTGHVGDSSTPNCIIRQVMIQGFRRGVEFGSRAYFVRFQNSDINRCWAGIYSGANPKDNAEKDTFQECVIAENRTAVDSTAGAQVYTFTGCSFDFNEQLFNLALGAKVFLNSCHLEFNYGMNAGETRAPVAITSSSTGIWGRNCVLAYNDTIHSAPNNQNPAWTSFATMDNGAQVFDMEFSKVDRMGRIGNTTGFDAWVTVSGNVQPMVRVKCDVVGIAVTDVPCMTSVAESFGSVGILRQGCGYPFIQLNNVTARTGTASALAHVAADENGVTRKNGLPMVKLQNGTPLSSALYYISFPAKNFNARHVWSWLFDTRAITVGAPVVKEMLATFAPKFDGTTVTWGPAPDSPTYSNASGVTLAAGQSWTRHSWKDHAPSFYPSLRSNPCDVITLVIDMTSCTGPLYLSHIGFDVMSNSN